MTLLLPFCYLHWQLQSCFTNRLQLTLKTHCVCLEQNSTGKRLKDFQAGGFPCCILHNTYFFLKPVTEIKKTKQNKTKKSRCKESRGISQRKAPFYDEDYIYQDSKLQPMLLTNKVVCLCQVSKLHYIYAMGSTLFSVLKTTKHTWLYQI